MLPRPGCGNGEGTGVSPVSNMAAGRGRPALHQQEPTAHKKTGQSHELTLPGLNYILAQALDYGPFWGWTPAIQVPHVLVPLTYIPLPQVAATLLGFVPGSSGAAAE
jgi:hypothetical protein